jgi:hypothetical protein
VNWASLILAAVFGTPAVVLLLHRKAPRVVAILGALAALCLLAGIPSLLATLGHPLAPGPVLLGLVAASLASATFFYLDVLRGHHKDPLMGRKAIASQDGKGGGGGNKNHHTRPLVATVGLAVFGLMVAMNWSAVVGGIGGGFTQTETTITHPQSGA